MSPLRIQAEKSLVKKIAIGALAVLGGGAFAYVGKLSVYFFCRRQMAYVYIELY
jgi:hypothetical protein